MALRIPHFGGGKERQPRETSEQFEERKKVALGWHVKPQDQLEAQLTYVAGERIMFPDESLAGDLHKLHPDMEEPEIQSLVGRVNSIRHPDQAQDPKKL